MQVVGYGTFTTFSTYDIYGNLAGRCQFTSGSNFAVYRCPIGQALISGTCQSATLTKIPATQEEFEEAVEKKPSFSPASKILDAIRDAVKAEPDATKHPTLQTPKLTGPQTGSKPKETIETKPDGTTTTTTTTTNYTYTDNSVKNTITQITKIYSPISNTTTTTTKTDDSPNSEPPKDFCVDHPERVGCMEVDTPEGTIPKVDKNVTYTAESVFGGGSCPPPINTQYFGSPVILSYQPTCDVLQNYLKYIVIASALFTAYVIIIKGLKT